MAKGEGCLLIDKVVPKIKGLNTVFIVHSLNQCHTSIIINLIRAQVQMSDRKHLPMLFKGLSEFEHSLTRELIHA